MGWSHPYTLATKSAYGCVSVCIECEKERVGESVCLREMDILFLCERESV